MQTDTGKNGAQKIDLGDSGIGGMYLSCKSCVGCAGYTRLVVPMECGTWDAPE